MSVNKMGSADSKPIFTKTVLGYIVPKGVVRSITNTRNMLKAQNKGYTIYPTSDAAIEALKVMKTIGAVTLDQHGEHYQIYKWDRNFVYATGGDGDDVGKIDTRESMIVPTIAEAKQYMAKVHHPNVGEYVISFGSAEQIDDADNIYSGMVTYPTLALAKRAEALIEAHKGIIVHNGQLYWLFADFMNDPNGVLAIKNPPDLVVKIPYAQVRAFKNGTEMINYIRHHQDTNP